MRYGKKKWQTESKQMARVVCCEKHTHAEILSSKKKKVPTDRTRRNNKKKKKDNSWHFWGGSD